MRWAMLVAVVVAGCAAQVRSTPSPSAEPRTAQVGCASVSVERRPDRALAPVVRYAVANRCADPLAVDLAWASVIGRTADGIELALIPDGTRETAATVAPGATYEATLGYTAAASIGQLCVDVASVAATPRGAWTCFGNVVSVTMR